MICLDTNYLILSLVQGSPEADQLIAWSKSGEPLYAPALVWYEFLCGPVEETQASVLRAILHDVLPFDEAQAAEAARLFNAVERKRSLRVDAMIAAAALVRQAPLATDNRKDFEVFTPHGLRLY